MAKPKVVPIDSGAGLGDFEPSRTIQEHSIGIDPNDIMKRFQPGDTFPDARKLPSRVPGVFMDQSVVPDMFTALNMKKQLDDFFSSLRSSVREEFRNDPMVFAKFVADPRNFDRGVQLGIFEKPKEIPKGSPEAPGSGGSGSGGSPLPPVGDPKP